MWIVEGLIEPSTSLLVIQRRSIDDDEANFEMHNPVHDLATMHTFPYYIRFDENHMHKIHNFSCNRELYDSFNKFEKQHELKCPTTFLTLPLQEILPLRLLSNKVVHDILPTMKQLRVLSLSNYKSIIEISNSIKNLLYL